MSGRCYSCTVEFGLFKKEHACKNCGYAFCSKCLTKKIEISKLQNEKHSVCDRCYNILTGKTKPKPPVKLSPPENYKKRVAAYESRKAGGGSYAASGPPRVAKSEQEQVSAKYKYYNLSKEDIDLAKRLEKLKENQKQMEAPPSREELEGKLARLQGQDPAAVNKNPGATFYHPPDRRTQEEIMRDLMDEMFDEVELDKRHQKPDDDMADRLARLKDQEPPKTDSNMGNNLNKSSSQPDENCVMNIPAGGQDASTTGKDDKDLAMLKEMNQLIAQTAKELELDAKKAVEDLAKDKELMDRLKKLKEHEKEKADSSGHNVTDQNETGEESDEEDEEHTIKKLIKQCLEESKIDESAIASGLGGVVQHKKTNVPDQNADRDPDELPWCCLCNADAVLQCHDCDDDLYCMTCFKKSHDKYEIKEHRTTRYRPAKKPDS